MKEISWHKLEIFQKIIFSLGWIGVLNLSFWIALIIHNNITQEDKFEEPLNFSIELDCDKYEESKTDHEDFDHDFF